ncbi:MAG: hypothetical protein ACKPKO_25245, partial [Candidatus Fonsibacter sp.]
TDMSDMYIVCCHCNLKQICVVLQPKNSVHEVKIDHDESANLILSAAGTQCVVGPIKLATIVVHADIIMRNRTHAG